MADRIVVLNGGRVEQIGKPLELYNQPNNVFLPPSLAHLESI